MARGETVKVVNIRKDGTTCENMSKVVVKKDIVEKVAEILRREVEK